MNKQLALPFPPEYIEIPLSQQGKHAGKYISIVSPDDSDLAELNWRVKIISDTLQYVRRIKRQNGKQTPVNLHRIILERMINRPLENHEEVDHINGNGLDNRRENLRLATHSQNSANRRLARKGISGFRGVTWFERDKKWKAQIQHKGKHIHIGYFDIPEDAYAAYCKKAHELFGEFARYE